MKGFSEGDEVKVVSDGKFSGVEGEVLDVYEAVGKTWVMTFLYMPYDRKKEFNPTDLEKIE